MSKRLSREQVIASAKLRPPCRAESGCAQPQLNRAHRTRRESPFERVGRRNCLLTRLENLRIQRADFLPRIFRRNFEHAPTLDSAPTRRKCCFNRSRIVPIRNVKKKFVSAPARGHIEIL